MDVNGSEASLTEQLTYVGGELASSMVWNMISGFLLFYYTDVALLPVAAVGTLMLLSRVLDAVIDPVVGVMVDRTESRWGKARPYLLFVSVPFGIFAVLCFAVPDWSPMAKLAYAYVTFIVTGLLYSFIYVPYGAMQPMIVQDRGATVRLGSWRAMATSIASIVAYGSVTPLVNLAGPEHQAQGFTLAASVLSALSVALYLLVYFNCRERHAVARPPGGNSLGRDLRQLFGNPVWRIVVGYALLTFIRLGSMLSVAAYFAIYILGSPGLIGLMLTLLSVGILAGGAVASWLLRRLGIRRANIIFLALSVALILLLPGLESRPIAFVVVFAVANLVGGVVAASMFALCTDAVRVHEQRTGRRNEGLMFASVSFGLKVGMAIGTAGTAFALAAAGYQPGSHSPDSLQAIRSIFYVTPVVISVLQIVCIWAYRGDLGAAIPERAG